MLLRQLLVAAILIICISLAEYFTCGADLDVSSEASLSEKLSSSGDDDDANEARPASKLSVKRSLLLFLLGDALRVSMEALIFFRLILLMLANYYLMRWQKPL